MSVHRLSVLLTACLVQLGSMATPGLGDDLDRDFKRKVESADAAKAKLTADLVKQNNERIKELEGQLAKVKEWTKAQFELGERGVIDKPKAMSSLLKRWQENHEREIYQLLQFPDKSRGAIESGRALNQLLAQIGPAAYQHWQTRQLDSSHALPLYEPTAARQVDERLLRQLVRKQKSSGATVIGRFNQDPIDVDWPPFLREERWAEHRNAIEAARKQVMVELSQGYGVSSKTDQKMRDAVGRLNSEFNAYKRDWVANFRDAGKSRAEEYQRIWDARRHIQKLITSVYQVVSARQYEDVAPAEPFHGGNIEEFLAYLHRNNTEFAPAAGTDREAYHRLFDMMVRYYLDIKAMTSLEDRLESEVAGLKQTNQEAIDLALGKTMTAAEKVALDIEQMKFVRALLKD
jgi:hypothetical protein